MGYQPMLGLIMFGMGLTLSPSYFRIVLSRPRDGIYLSLAPTSAMSLTCTFEFLRFKIAKNKASATHFQNVVLPP